METETPQETGPRRRVRASVAVLAAVLVVAAAAAGIVVLRNARQTTPFAGARTTFTGADLVRELGPAVAREGSGHLDLSNGERPEVQTVDFVLNGGHVDFVFDAGEDMRLVAKNGVVVATGGEPMNIADPRVNGKPAQGLEAIPAFAAQSMALTTFQKSGPSAGGQFPPDAVYTRSRLTDDGVTEWTSSWAAPGQLERVDVRLTIDAAGLPAELKVTVTQGPGVDEPPSVSVQRYSRWGQRVQVPEPTPFGRPSVGPPGAPTDLPSIEPTDAPSIEPTDLPSIEPPGGTPGGPSIVPSNGPSNGPLPSS